MKKVKLVPYWGGWLEIEEQMKAYISMERALKETREKKAILMNISLYDEGGSSYKVYHLEFDGEDISLEEVGR